MMLYNQGLILGRSGHFYFPHLIYSGTACCKVGTGISLSGNKVAGV
jgi:hypothetical protein